MVRLCARKKHGQERLTRAEIIRASGLAGVTIDRLSRARSWDKYSVQTIAAFTAACGVDLANLRRHREFLKTNKHAAWRKVPNVYGKILSYRS